ncbi:MAG: uracil-DNA glycosylase family protein [Verrucomicrobia bacterium]|nr:uracil-DNA glycosylase family protein [Verrucomicrobiota bacterium]MDA1065658.1 uracil-DNA glycosylase family protein [Verrucomicrobiota bacterium]
MNQKNLDKHLLKLKACHRCPKMHKPVVVGEAALSKVILVGQAPGVKEPVLQRPFGWTAGKTLFRWFKEGVGIEEPAFREWVYMAAVCRCYPGKNPKGGDRVPDPEEIENCAGWLKDELQLLKPELVIPVGKLAIQQFVSFGKLTDAIGETFRIKRWGVSFDMIPLPHPSGASTWHRMEPGKALTQKALKKLKNHPSFKAVLAQAKIQD